MFESLRQSMAWLHTWSGLLLAWVLYFMFITGSLGYFDTALDRWMKPEVPYQPYLSDASDAIDAAQSFLQQHAIDAKSWYLTLPEPRNPYLHIEWHGNKDGKALFDLKGNQLHHRATGGGQWLYELHFKLHYLPIKLAYWIVCIASMVMLVGLVSGIIIHKKIFVDLFTFRRKKKARTWLDIHNLLSVSALPFHLMITYSGLLFLSSTYLAPVYDTAYDQNPGGYPAFSEEFFGPSHPTPGGIRSVPTQLNSILDDAKSQWRAHPVRLITVHQPGDSQSITRLIRMIGPHVERSDRLYYASATGKRLDYHALDGLGKDIRMTMVNLHEGLFAGPLLRCLLFLSGLAGAGMIATGLILWVEKRRARKSTPQGRHTQRLIEKGNSGVLIGTLVAIGAYFWSNRLIPADWIGRESIEQNIFFAALLMCIFYCLAQRTGRGVKHLVLLTATLYGLLPWVDEWLGGKGLVTTFTDGDTILFSFNLVLLLIALASVWTLYKLYLQRANTLTCQKSAST